MSASPQDCAAQPRQPPRACSDKKLMEDTETAADPRAKVSMKKIFGGPNTKKDGTQGKARPRPLQAATSARVGSTAALMVCSRMVT